MSLEFKCKEEEVIYFEDLEWISEINVDKNTYLIPKQLPSIVRSVIEINDDINKTFRNVCLSMIKLINYISEDKSLPVFVVFTNEKLELEIKCVKKIDPFTKGAEFSRKISLEFDKEENCISFIYPSDFDSELGSRTPKYIENLTYPVRVGDGYVEGQFNNDNVERIIRQFILGIEEEAKHY